MAGWRSHTCDVACLMENNKGSHLIERRRISEYRRSNNASVQKRCKNSFSNHTQYLKNTEFVLRAIHCVFQIGRQTEKNYCKKQMKRLWNIIFASPFIYWVESESCTCHGSTCLIYIYVYDYVYTKCDFTPLIDAARCSSRRFRRLVNVGQGVFVYVDVAIVLQPCRHCRIY